MPQLDVATFPSLLFWLGISFLLLYLGLKIFILPHLVSIFEERQSNIETFLEKAEELQKEAETFSRLTEKKLEEAKAASQSRIADMVQHLAHTYREQEQKLTKNILEKEQAFEEKNTRHKQEIKKQLLEEFPQVMEKFLKETMHIDVSSTVIKEKMQHTLQEKRHVS